MFIVSKGKKKVTFFYSDLKPCNSQLYPNLMNKRSLHTLTVTSNAVIIIFDFRDEAKSDLPF